MKPINMNKLIGSHDIVFITLDTLRFDVAKQELEAGNLPVLGQYINQWQERHAPGSFTYSSHQAMFAGFMPTPANNPSAPRLMAVDFPGSETINENTTVFNTPTIIEGLAQQHYKTVCIGGVGFFNLLTPLGRVLPGYFQEQHWSPELGVSEPRSTEYQMQLAGNIIASMPTTEQLFLFINISAIHQPNYFYLENYQPNDNDSLASHGAALRYVDSQLASLFKACQQKSPTLFIICSDHGTTYSSASSNDDGYNGHRLAHPSVWTVPYSEFIVNHD